MRYKHYLFVVLVSLATAQVGWAKPGDFDTTFGDPEHPGFLRIGPTTLKTPGGSDANQLCLGTYCGQIATRYPDGRLLFYMGYFVDNPFGFLRYEADGKIDKNFGAMAGVESKFGEWNAIDQGYDYATQIAMAPDGKIVVLGVCTAKVEATGKQEDALTLEQKKAKEVAEEKAKQEGTPTGGMRDICLARYNADGTLDQGFGKNGLTVTDLAPWETTHALTIQSDGKILVGGDIPCSKQYTFPVLRYDTSGKLDTTFGSEKTGVVNTSFGFYDCPCSTDGSKVHVPTEVQSIVTQPDGKILASGIFFSPALKRYLATIVRLLPSGVPDLNFGDQGKIIYDPPDFKNHAHDTVTLLQNDNIILVVSESWEGVMAGEADKGTYQEHMTIVRFLPDGTIDKSFVQETTEIQFGADLDAVIQDTGKIVAKTRIDLLRFNADGKLDTSFGNEGKIKLWDESIPWGKVDYGQIKLRSESETGLILQPEGRIVVVGSALLQLNENDPQTETSFHDGFLRFWGNDCDKDKEITWYNDKDKDGLGDPSSTLSACAKPLGYVDNKDDCDDSNASVGKKKTYFLDKDNDGYGLLENSVDACSIPAGYVDTGGNKWDCNDDDPKIHPGSPELCDGLDNDCNDKAEDNKDTSVGKDCSTGLIGICASGTNECQSGKILCKQNFKPQPEICDGIDNDCDNLVDDKDTVEPGSLKTFYKDNDGDGFGSEKKLACSQPDKGYVVLGGDCKDDDKSVNPDAEEICNKMDDNCNGQIDEGLPFATYFEDKDKDNHGNAIVSKSFCKQPPGFVTSKDDCNDTQPLSYPGNTEACDGMDNNCDQQIDEGNFGGDKCNTGQSGLCQEGTSTCSQGKMSCISNYNPFGEICDGVDNDCNGKIDDNPAGAKKFYLDTDGDGFGDPNNSKEACSKPGGSYVIFGNDCNDKDKNINPDTEEVCSNGVDDDCNGVKDDC